MKRTRLAPMVPGLVLVLIGTVFIACGGNGPGIPDGQNSGGQIPTDQQAPAELSLQPGIESQLPEDAAENRVILEVPAINDLAAGDEFTAVIRLDVAEEIHQGVLRVLYDQEAMTPLEIVPGEILPSDMVRIAALDKSGFLPLAFTALPGATNIRPGQGDLFRIRFRLDRPGGEAGRISFRSDREFLQLRKRDGEHLRFDVDSLAGGRHAE